MPTVVVTGDSVPLGLQSTSGRGWRDKLRGTNPGISYLGTLGAGQFRHECRVGLTIVEAREAAMPAIVALKPDVVIIQAGVVDDLSMADPESPTPLLDAFAGAVHAMKAWAGACAWYGARVIVCSCPPNATARGVLVDRFNFRLSRSFFRMPNVVFVDVTGTLRRAEDFADDIHPNESGYSRLHARLAARWPPRLYRLGRGRGYSGAQRTGRGAWTL